MKQLTPNQEQLLSSVPALSDAYELHQYSLSEKGYSEKTNTFYRKLLLPFIEDCAQQGIDLPKITSKHISQYREKYRNHSPHTRHAVARAIRAFLNYCVEVELIKKSPFNNKSMPKLPKDPKPALTNEELERVFDACADKKEIAICQFLLSSGLRISELINLDFGDVNGTTVHVRLGKGGKSRITHINAKTQKAVKLYHMSINYRPQENDPMFVSLHKDRFTFDGMQSLMQRIKKQSGVKNFSAHALRRTFATNALRNGIDLYNLARLMGHNDIRTLQHYLGERWS